VVERIAELHIDPTLDPSPARIGLVWAEGIAAPKATANVPPFLTEVLAVVRDKGESFVSEARRKGVRDMLRYGTYRPSGRGKPASEFLLRAALSEAFPMVNPPVDVNNVVSLVSGLPASIFDADKSGWHLLLRRGTAGEAYVFNPSAQSIDLEDLLLVCRASSGTWVPCGNPVKDAMETKIGDETRNVVGVLYAPLSTPRSELEAHLEQYRDLLLTHCGAQHVAYVICQDDP
jgi:DNA/RNA-binding domain of Phe-tRNA-synthetase-like protein